MFGIARAIYENTKAICALTCTVQELGCNDRQTQAILNRLAEMEKRIMSAISDYAGRVSTAFDKISTAVDGVVDDVAFLKEEIVKLQNSPGPITPEDQATLDGLEARANTTVAALEALDAATARPPTPPPV